MESSRRDLLNDMTEHRLTLKNNQNKYHPRFGFTPNTGTSSPKRGFVFTKNCHPEKNYFIKYALQSKKTKRNTTTKMLRTYSLTYVKTCTPQRISLPGGAYLTSAVFSPRSNFSQALPFSSCLGVFTFLLKLGGDFHGRAGRQALERCDEKAAQ